MKKGVEAMVIKNNFFKALSLIVMLITVCAMVLTGCDKEEDIKSDVADEEGEYTIYYTSKELNGIYSYVYESDETDTNELIHELIGELEKGNYEGTREPVIPKELSDPAYSINFKGIVTVDFGAAYANMQGMDEILVRACIVKTLCQVNDINGVEFYVGGSPLVINDGVVVTDMDEADGNVSEEGQESHARIIGVMNQYDFVSSVSGESTVSEDGSHVMQSDILTLYYANESGNGLESAYLRVEYDNSISVEQLVASQLIDGPVTDKCYRAVNENTVINKISTKEKVCFVDLSSDFLNVPDGVNLEVSVYSVVDSLLELPAVTKVKILIDGEVYTQFADDGLMDRNYLVLNE